MAPGKICTRASSSVLEYSCCRRLLFSRSVCFCASVRKLFTVCDGVQQDPHLRLSQKCRGLSLSCSRDFASNRLRVESTKWLPVPPRFVSSSMVLHILANGDVHVSRRAPVCSFRQNSWCSLRSSRELLPIRRALCRACRPTLLRGRHQQLNLFRQLTDLFLQPEVFLPKTVVELTPFCSGASFDVRISAQSFSSSNCLMRLVIRSWVILSTRFGSWTTFCIFSHEENLLELLGSFWLRAGRNRSSPSLSVLAAA